jgi:hypothetical protein
MEFSNIYRNTHKCNNIPSIFKPPIPTLPRKSQEVVKLSYRAWPTSDFSAVKSLMRIRTISHVRTITTKRRKARREEIYPIKKQILIAQVNDERALNGSASFGRKKKGDGGWTGAQNLLNRRSLAMHRLLLSYGALKIAKTL